RQNIFTLDAFKNGYFEVQDAASQAVAPFLRPEAGMRVVDACAGAGGKTLHISSLMKNKCRIIAMDVGAWKLNGIGLTSRSAGVNTLVKRVIDSSKVIKRLDKSADMLLLDVPCSGTGVLKRNPVAKCKLSEGFIHEVRHTQQTTQ